MNDCNSISIPSDKSITHRAIIIASLAHGRSVISNPLLAEDCLMTLNAIKNLGIKFMLSENLLEIHGKGKYGLQAKAINNAPQKIYCGNSATTMRLLAGVLAAQNFSSELSGDDSLHKRPMSRIVEPLISMEANIKSNNGYPSIIINPCKQLLAKNHVINIPSAQVKSCLMLAAIYADGETKLKQHTRTRDHTEILFQQFQYSKFHFNKQENEIIIQGGHEFTATNIDIPGDFSSAAFFIVATLITPKSKLLIKNVGINPTRTGLVTLLSVMGANIKFLNIRNNIEPVADIYVEYSSLTGIEVPANLVANAIDEFPIFFIAAAVASGTTTLKNAYELTIKESNRILVMAEGLMKLGIKCEISKHGIIINGGVIQGGIVDSKDDHRVSMAFLIANTIATNPVIVKNKSKIKTSFPTFFETCAKIGLVIHEN